MNASPDLSGGPQKGAHPSLLPSLLGLFFLGSVVGYFLEGIADYLDKGKWLPHAATVWGPFCVIYGVGAAGAYLLGSLVEHKSCFLQFICCAASGAAVEYLGSLLQEKLLGSRSWNYASHACNLNGRISLKMTLLWGALGLAFIRWLLPLIRRSFICRPWRGKRLLLTALTCLMVIDLLITGCALLRWKGRLEGRPAGNAVEAAMDIWFDDETLSKRFFNMRFDWEPSD